MIEFRTLGRIELLRPDGTLVLSVASRSKALGLLAYLVLSEGDGARRREDVCALLWPESDESRARNSLNQTLHVLRSSLGSEVVTGGRETVGVEAGRIRCDAVDFRRAIAGADWEKALGLYGGELLPGLHVTGSIEFERWLDQQRSDLRRAAFSAARRVADQTAGDDRGTIRALRHARKIRPDDDETVRDLMAACQRQGNVTAALKEYESYRTWLSENVGLEPPEETRQLAAQLRTANGEAAGSPTGKPQSVWRDGTAVGAADTGTADERPETGEPATGGKQRRPGKRIWASLVIAVIAIVTLDAGWSIVRERASDGGDKGLLSESEVPPLDPDVLAVLPFSFVGDNDVLADLADDLPLVFYWKITGEFGPRAVEPKLVRAEWERVGGSPDMPPTEADAVQAARNLAAGQLIRGTVMGTEDAMEIHASLVDIETGTTTPPSIQRGPYADWPRLVDQLVIDLLATHYEDLADRIPRLGEHRPEAVQAYLAGVRTWNRQQGDYEAIDFFREAVERDSTFVLAAMAGFFAGETDEYLAKIAWENRDALSPRDRAILTAGAGKLFGEIESIREEIDAWERVLELDPENFQANYELAEAYMGAGNEVGVADRLSRVKRHAKRALRQDPGHLMLHWKLSEVALLEGDSAAIAEHLAAFDSLASPESCGRARRHGQARAFGFDLEPLSDEYGGMGSFCEVRAIIEGTIMTGLSVDLAKNATRAFDDVGGPSFIPRLASVYWGWHDMWLKYVGRPSWEAFPAPPPRTDDLLENIKVVREAIYIGLPDELSAHSVRLLRQVAGQEAYSDADRESVASARCWLSQWNLSGGDTTGVSATIRYLREDVPVPAFFSACAALLEAWRPRVAGIPHTAATLRYDSLARRAPVYRQEGPTGEFWPIVNLSLARWFREDGDYERALAAARRGRRWAGMASLFSEGYDVVFQREQAPLHALVGDTAAAIAVYERYLTLREEANGPWAVQLDSVQAEYRALTGGLPDSARP
jgi:DNA-binding SARP family transcriptional activator